MPILPMGRKIRDILIGQDMQSHIRDLSPALDRRLFAVAVCLLTACGCTPITEFVHNGFKVGPNYKEPPAPVAKNWIDINDKRLSNGPDEHATWWTNFNDPVLNDLICDAYKQNLTLKEAGMRILEAKANRNIAIGNLFPQTQQATGDFVRTVYSKENVNSEFLPRRYTPEYDVGFNLSWELDFWGRFRRALESTEATLQASVYDYDDVLITLLYEVATNYVNMRVAEKRIKYAKENVELQQKTVKVVSDRFTAGTANKLALVQAEALLYQTEASMYALEITERQAANQICVLLGMPPQDLQARLGKGNIPTAPADIALGVPADLLRRRPDVRKAERLAAAQSAQIGYAESDFYPHIMITGQILREAAHFRDLFNPLAYQGFIEPMFQWNILNYGRIRNNVRLQDSTFKELVLAYQQTVLNAQLDVENGLITFLKGLKEKDAQEKAVKAAEAGVSIVLAQYESGAVTIAQLILFEQNLVQQQDTLAVNEGVPALGLIQAYKALGGGWQIRVNGCPTNETLTAPPFPPPPVPLPGEMKAKFGPPM